jgi:hypothetical protein
MIFGDENVSVNRFLSVYKYNTVVENADNGGGCTNGESGFIWGIFVLFFEFFLNQKCSKHLFE